MAEKNRYPQIPSTVWWGVRSILQRTPNATIDERLLGIQIGVQEAAAKAYVAELRSVGILTEDGKASPLAQKWRLDETYSEAVAELIANAYPEGLRDVAPPAEGDRQKIVSWFQREGLGQGAAGNKAATYLLIGSTSPNEAPTRGGVRQKKEASDALGSKTRPAADRKPPVARGKPPRASNQEIPRGGLDSFPLNVNVQIHISADAGAEQIESIFRAMRRYLYDAPID